jgi:hypothetical protein
MREVDHHGVRLVFGNREGSGRDMRKKDALYVERQKMLHTYYSTFTDKPEHNCHFPAPGRNCMTHH